MKNKNVVDFDMKKKEISVDNITGLIEDFGERINDTLDKNSQKIIKSSKQMFNALSNLKINSGFDIYFKTAMDNSSYSVAVRCIELTKEKNILVGGYGFRYKAYDCENIFNNEFDENITKEIYLQDGNHIEFLYNKIITEFIEEYNVTKILKVQECND